MSLLRIASAFLVFALYGAPIQAQSTGSVAGCIVDETSGPLPGVTVQVWTPQREFTTATNDKGCYAFETLPADVYTISASLTGFGRKTRDDVRVGVGTRQQLNFWLRVGAICDCFGAPENLRELWEWSFAVAHVRIDRILTAVLPNKAVRRGAVVLEVFKRHPDGVPADDRVTFGVGPLQGYTARSGQPNTYAPGDEFVMFFNSWQEESRVFMIYSEQTSVMAVDRAQMVRLPFGAAREMPVENLLAQLRVFAAERGILPP